MTRWMSDRQLSDSKLSMDSTVLFRTRIMRIRNRNFGQVRKANRIALLWGAFLLVGCETSLQPGDPLYALPNASRTWTIPAIKPSPQQDSAALLVIDPTDFSCGSVEQSVPVVREFTITNRGSAPLHLHRFDKTEAITLSAERLTNVQPGEHCRVQLRWTPGKAGHIAHEVMLRTNDPKRPLLNLSVAGDVYRAVTADPPLLLAERIRPDRPADTSVLISSEWWDDFTIDHVNSDLDGMAWVVEPAEEKLLHDLQAKSGWWLRATFPAGLEPGEISDRSLSVQLVPKHADRDEAGEPRQLEIPIRAKVLRRLAVYGGGVDRSGTIRFGVQPRGVAHTRKLTVKVNDEQTQLDLREVVTVPEFLEVDFKPYPMDSEMGNLYQLEVKIPAGAPEHIARGPKLGKIHLKFDHPRIEELNRGIDFVLHGRATIWSLRDVIN